MKDFQELLLRECKKKWWIVLSFAIIVAVVLIVEKLVFTDTVAKSGRYYVSRTVAINYLDEAKTPVYVDYSPFFTGFGELAHFIAYSEQKYDYTRFHGGWEGMSQLSKLQWMRKHIWVTTASPFICRFEMELKEEEIKDAAYLEEIGGSYLGTWVDFAHEQLEKAGYRTDFRTVDEYTLLPEVQVVSKKRMIVKYGITGVVLGSLLGIMVIFVYALRKRNHA